MAATEHRDHLSTEDFQRLAEVGEKVSFEPDEKIFSQGDPSDALYAIEEGAVRLEFGEGKATKTLGPGALFGELFLGQGSLRTADAVADTKTLLRRIDCDHVEVLKETQPSLLCSLLQGTCATLLASETDLVTSLRQRNRELEDAFDFLLRTHRELGRESLLARTDETTGLYNKRCLNDQFEDFAARAKATGWELGMVWIDLDNFKRVNTFSYETGDEVLRHVATALRRVIQPWDLPCRWGGDEFCVLMPAVSQGNGSSDALRLHKALSGQTVPHGNSEIRISLSMGGAELAPGETFTELRARSNESLLLAKRSGKDCVVWEGELIHQS